MSLRMGTAAALLVVAPMVAPVSVQAAPESWGSIDFGSILGSLGSSKLSSSAPGIKPDKPTSKPSNPGNGMTVSTAHGFVGSKYEQAKAQRVFELTNLERTKRGIKPLKLDRGLTEGAYGWAQRMDHKQDFTHSGLNVGENLFWFAAQGDAELIVQSWMNSPGHRDNILNPEYSKIGVGVSDAGNGTYAVQRFYF